MATSVKYVDVEQFNIMAYGSSWTVQATWGVDYASSSRAIRGDLGRGWQHCDVIWYGSTTVIDEDGRPTTNSIVLQEETFTDMDGSYSNPYLLFTSTIQPPDGFTEVYVLIRIRSERNATQTWDDDHHLLKMDTYFSDLIFYKDWAEVHPPTPSAPSVSLDNNGTKVTVSYSNVPSTVYGAKIKVYRKDSANGTAVKMSTEYTVKRASDGSITWTDTLSKGYMYAFSALYLGNYGTSSKPKYVEGEEGDVSDWITTAPVNNCIAAQSFQVTAVQQNEVNVTWKVYSEQDKLDGVKIQYAKTKAELEAESGASFNEVEYAIVVTSNNKGNVRISGLETGTTWYFRIRGYIEYNGTKYYANWYSIKTNGKYEAVSITLGTIPDAPTTWTLQQTFAYEDNNTSGFEVYAIHNSEDGSACQSFKVYADVYDEHGTYLRHLINGRVVSNGKDQYGNYLTDNLSYKIRPYYEYATRDYFDQKEIHWWIQTKGAMPSYSPSSLVRVVKLYKQPQASVSVASQDSDGGFPIKATMSLTSAHQTALVYYLEITSRSSYTYYDAVGEERTVLPGDIMFSATYTASSSEGTRLVKTLNATDINLTKNKSYEATVTIYTSGGLTATSSSSFTFLTPTTPSMYPAIKEFEIDDDRSMYLKCICYQNSKHSGTVWSSVSYKMSLYRCNSDGTYTLIQDNIPSSSSGTWVHDPHPRLDHQVYRIVSTYTPTGQKAYSEPDFAADLIKNEGVIIHWDEKWGTGIMTRVNGPQVSRYIGKRVRLPFNVDVTEKRSVDKTLINYAGRESPVSYYGTAIDKSYSIKTEIPKHNVNEFNSDEAMLLLRRLSIKKEDVYVRTCTGIGCWATVDIEYNIDHCALTIPITITVTPVEGGA